MSEIEYTVQINAPVDEVWSFIEDFQNWARFVIGYQKMELVNEKRSTWTLRGDVGMLAREVDIQVDITEWMPGERVEFQLTGLTERISGSGSMVMTAVQPGEKVIEGRVDADGSSPSWGKRLQAKVARSVIDRATTDGGHAEVTNEPDVPFEGESSRLTGRLQLQPGGAMAPMLDMLMAPMLQPAAEDLVRGIRGALEKNGSAMR
ncbi:CoxG family protein [Glaciibacter superstes]|uniref:CoxG family protein n=1 Tax=Glaciibacter superstes TaxID=501023 RepID=UPI0003B5B2DF|nr:SRPBCC family protein [Glaciibacter superstes]